MVNSATASTSKYLVAKVVLCIIKVLKCRSVYMKIYAHLLLLLKLGQSLLSGFLLALALLQESFGDEDLVMGRDASVSG